MNTSLFLSYWPLWLLVLAFAVLALSVREKRLDLSIRATGFEIGSRSVAWFFSALFAGLAVADWGLGNLGYEPHRGLTRLLWLLLGAGALAICSGMLLHPPALDHEDKNRLSEGFRQRRLLSSVTAIGAIVFNGALAVWLVQIALTLFGGLKD